MRKTKIVCTIGPATAEVEKLKQMIKAGMNVARINFSHGGIEEQQKYIDSVKKAREEMKAPVALMIDTKGPELRIGSFENGSVTLAKGQYFSLIYEDIPGTNAMVPVNYKELYKDVQLGTRILLDDGEIELTVVDLHDKDIVCKVINGGILSNHKSINIPEIHLSLPFLSAKDKADIKAACEQDFDLISASFTRTADDIKQLRDLLKKNGGENIKIISKIENKEGVENFDEILELSDGIMVARGDLGVEIPLELVPILQKKFIQKCNKTGKMVITATQMLESMMSEPRPTRAEVSDVANAIFDETGAIMLSGESATGAYPVECVKMMDKIALAVEENINYWKRFNRRDINFLENPDYEYELDHSATMTACEMKATAIFAYTETGRTPRLVASFLPDCPIYAITSTEKTYRQLAQVWGVNPILVKGKRSPDSIIAEGIEIAKTNKFVKKGDVVILAGGASILSNNTETINRSIGGILKI